MSCILWHCTKVTYHFVHYAKVMFSHQIQPILPKPFNNYENPKSMTLLSKPLWFSFPIASKSILSATLFVKQDFVVDCGNVTTNLSLIIVNKINKKKVIISREWLCINMGLGNVFFFSIKELMRIWHSNFSLNWESNFF